MGLTCVLHGHLPFYRAGHVFCVRCRKRLR